MQSEEVNVGKRTGQTFSVDPEKRPRRLPLLKKAAFQKPGRCFLVMSATCDVVVRRGIRWREPFVNALSELVP